jgi:hypothetical protein
MKRRKHQKARLRQDRLPRVRLRKCLRARLRLTWKDRFPRVKHLRTDSRHLRVRPHGWDSSHLRVMRHLRWSRSIPGEADTRWITVRNRRVIRVVLLRIRHRRVMNIENRSSTSKPV